MQGSAHHTECDLIAQLMEGDKQAFTELYIRYSKDLYLNLRRLVKTDTLAEELLQEIFVLIWEKREQLHIHQSFRSYLFRIGENKVYDFFRKVKRDQKLYCSLKTIATQAFENDFDPILTASNAALLQKAIEALPPQRKQVFQLCKLEGKSYKDVSAELGISAATVNDHIVKAMTAIRAFMQKHPELVLASLFSVLLQRL